MTNTVSPACAQGVDDGPVAAFDPDLGHVCGEQPRDQFAQACRVVRDRQSLDLPPSGSTIDTA